MRFNVRTPQHFITFVSSKPVEDYDAVLNAVQDYCADARHRPSATGLLIALHTKKVAIKTDSLVIAKVGEGYCWQEVRESSRPCAAPFNAR